MSGHGCQKKGEKVFCFVSGEMRIRPANDLPWEFLCACQVADSFVSVIADEQRQVLT